MSLLSETHTVLPNTISNINCMYIESIKQLYWTTIYALEWLLNKQQQRQKINKHRANS